MVTGATRSFGATLEQVTKAVDPTEGEVLFGLSVMLGRRAGTVLIAEDERALRRLSATVIGQAGYDTLEAADGQLALDLFTVHADKIVMVVTDVVMPRMGGIELAARLRQSHPYLPILFVTGYAENAVLSHGHLGPGMQVVTKPFDMGLLAERIRAMIRGGA